MFVTIIVFLVVLSVLVLVHEFGHFITARFFKVGVEEFGLGFPPRAIGVKRENSIWKLYLGKKEIIVNKLGKILFFWKKDSDTIYSINWIPLGGFVRIKGENGESNEPDSFVNKKVWQRFIIISAGVIMNFILAGVLLSAGYMVGLPKYGGDIPEGGTVISSRLQISEVMDGSAASITGLEVGDTVLTLDGQSFQSEELFRNYIKDNNKEINLKLLRRGEEQSVEFSPQMVEGLDYPVLGIVVSESSVVRFGFFESFWQGFKMAGEWLARIIVAFYDFFKGLIVGNSDTSAELAGPVGVARITGDAARLGFGYLLQFTALLSLNLAVINFFPFPALDGGRALFLIIEAVKGKPVKREVETVIHNIGFIMLLALMAWATLSDVLKLFN